MRHHLRTVVGTTVAVAALAYVAARIITDEVLERLLYRPIVERNGSSWDER